MAYADFTLSAITKQFGLIFDERTDIFAAVPPISLRESFQTQLDKTVSLALKLSTEKARSEFIIAPILAELWLIADQKVGLFSGVEFIVEPSQGLAGTCDFIITRSHEQYFIKAPVLMVVEAKNEDMKRGYAQCIAEMLAARMFNEREGEPNRSTYGAVSIGERWKFLELEDTTVRIDAADYYIADVGKILGILLEVATSPQ